MTADRLETRSAALSPAQLQILMARLEGITREMSAVLRRASYSPNIKERADFSSALFTATGELLVQAENIPVHLGSMPASVAAVLERFDGRLRPGDQVAVNDPFCGGTHLNDITVVAPCFSDTGAPGEGAVAGAARLVGWVANRAHHADVGGAAPGSMPADASEIFQEGLRLPPVLVDDTLRAILLANTRTPDERAGDLDAQLGANRVGVARLALLADDALHEVVDYGERRMRVALAEVPDGRWRFEDRLDSAGSASPAAPIPLCVELTVRGDAVRVDFSGSAPQTAGNVNAVAAVTASAVAFALRSALDPTLPANGGMMRAVELVIPEGTVLAASAPAAVAAGNVEVSQRVADLCLGALAQACPGRVGAASQGTMNNVLVGGDGWVYYETVAGGQGGRPAVPGRAGAPRPGMSGVHTAMTNTKNTPIEALERAFPLRVVRQRLRQGSGGAGVAPGGEGLERDLQVLTDATVSLITERRVSQPWGLSGGEPGAVGENWLLPGGDEAHARRLPDKCTIQLRTGDVLRMLTPGGGGFGGPQP